jgi:hypothetical protein
MANQSVGRQLEVAMLETSNGLLNAMNARLVGHVDGVTLSGQVI